MIYVGQLFASLSQVGRVAETIASGFLSNFCAGAAVPFVGQAVVFGLPENGGFGGEALQVVCHLAAGSRWSVYGMPAEQPRQYVKSLSSEQYSLICRLLENKYYAFSVDIGIRAGLRQ